LLARHDAADHGEQDDGNEGEEQRHGDIVRIV
jgi:hypothetical protein